MYPPGGRGRGGGRGGTEAALAAARGGHGRVGTHARGWGARRTRRRSRRTPWRVLRARARVGAHCVIDPSKPLAYRGGNRGAGGATSQPQRATDCQSARWH